MRMVMRREKMRMGSRDWGEMVIWNYRIPVSFSAFDNNVSLTAVNTSLMFDVSVACVRLHEVKKKMFRSVRGARENGGLTEGISSV